MSFVYTKFIKYSVQNIGEFSYYAETLFNPVLFISGFDGNIYFLWFVSLDCMHWFCGRFALSAPSTSASVVDNCKEFYREGFILSLILDDGTVGFGEVSIRLLYIFHFWFYFDAFV
jgi:hypothetical protein